MINNCLYYLDRAKEKYGEKKAFCDEKTSLSFTDVFNISNAIGTCLSNKKIYKEPVLIYMEKSPEEIAAFFGVMRGGCFYVPIDSEMPSSRIALIIENCNPRLMIVDEACKKKADEIGFKGEVILYSDMIKTEADYASLDAINKKAIDTDPIYIVFTSGSTGVPKGVCACHRSVIDYVEQLSESLGFDETIIFGNQTPLYFDACLKELYPTLMFGGTTYLIPRQLFSQPIKLVEYINEKKINTICWVVSALTMISAFDTFSIVVPESLKLIAFGSEVFPIKQFNRWRKALPEAKFFNLYGPTEGTGMCCFYPVTREFEEGDAIPIGFPFKNTEILLLDEKGELADEGEICIRGTSVTLGYYNNKEKTDEAFVQNPLNKAYPELIYKTGDIGRLNSYGELEFVSRKDYQIKHMGHRIELGEIEANVNDVEEVKLCGAVYDKEKGKINLFYTGDISEKDLLEKLKEKLPRYMLPNRVRRLDEMPFTANGKLDRKTLGTMI